MSFKKETEKIVLLQANASEWLDTHYSRVND